MTAEAPYVDLQEPDDVDELMQPGAGPVVLDFWSTSCGPCRAMAPDFEAVARRYGEERIIFAKIQTDRHPELAQPFRIRSVPTLLFVADGEILDAVVGRMDETRLTKRVEWLLSRARGEGLFSRLFGRRS
jgi:thioredoxin 1